MPGALEKEAWKNCVGPYLDLRKVSKAEEAKVCQENQPKGTRQNSPVPSE